MLGGKTTARTTAKPMESMTTVEKHEVAEQHNKSQDTKTS